MDLAPLARIPQRIVRHVAIEGSPPGVSWPHQLLRRFASRIFVVPTKTMGWLCGNCGKCEKCGTTSERAGGELSLTTERDGLSSL